MKRDLVRGLGHLIMEVEKSHNKVASQNLGQSMGADWIPLSLVSRTIDTGWKNVGVSLVCSAQKT